MAILASRRILRAAVAAAVLALALELGLRLATGMGDPPLFQKDPEIGYLMAADQKVYRLGNRVSINSYHQRSESLSPLPPTGVRRILFIGDSITFGVASVDQSEIFPELVAARLRKRGEPVEVMNASAVSWGIGNELAYVERFGTFGSEIAVLQIGSSDLLQPTSTGEGVGTSPSQPDRKPLTAIGELLGRYLLPRLAERLRPEPERGEPVTWAGRDRQFRENMRHFRILASTIREQGTSPLVLLMPGLPEIVPEDGRLFTRYAPWRARFREVVEGLDLPLVDLSTEWQGEPKVPTYYTDGTHLTLEGNRAVAVRIVEAIDRMGTAGDAKQALRRRASEEDRPN